MLSDESDFSDAIDASDASEFNGDISNWNVENVISWYNIFKNSKFKGDISKWKINPESKFKNDLLEITN